MMLEIKNVKKSFGGLTVLDGISLEVERVMWWRSWAPAGPEKPLSCAA